MDYLVEQQDKANKELEQSNIEARMEDRVLWDKLITIVLAILGFSLTLFSTELLSQEIMSSYSKYFLLSCWIFYIFSIFLGFFLLKKESEFNRGEYLRKTLYAMDLAKLTINGLKVLEDKKDQYLALLILHGERTADNDFWKKKAREIYEKEKINLDSYGLIKEPEKFYSYSHRKLIVWCEKSFYFCIILSTILLTISVAWLFFK